MRCQNLKAGKSRAVRFSCFFSSKVEKGSFLGFFDGARFKIRYLQGFGSQATWSVWLKKPKTGCKHVWTILKCLGLILARYLHRWVCIGALVCIFFYQPHRRVTDDLLKGTSNFVRDHQLKFHGLCPPGWHGLGSAWASTQASFRVDTGLCFLSMV